MQSVSQWITVNVEQLNNADSGLGLETSWLHSHGHANKTPFMLHVTTSVVDSSTTVTM